MVLIYGGQWTVPLYISSHKSHIENFIILNQLKALICHLWKLLNTQFNPQFTHFYHEIIAWLIYKMLYLPTVLCPPYSGVIMRCLCLCCTFCRPPCSCASAARCCWIRKALVILYRWVREALVILYRQVGGVVTVWARDMRTDHWLDKMAWQAPL